MASTVNGGVDTERVALLWLLAASTSRSLSFAFAACSIHPQPITTVAAFPHARSSPRPVWLQSSGSASGLASPRSERCAHGRRYLFRPTWWRRT